LFAARSGCAWLAAAGFGLPDRGSFSRSNKTSSRASMLPSERGLPRFRSRLRPGLLGLCGLDVP
jgi:hypothetical protein